MQYKHMKEKKFIQEEFRVACELGVYLKKTLKALELSGIKEPAKEPVQDIVKQAFAEII